MRIGRTSPVERDNISWSVSWVGIDVHRDTVDPQVWRAVLMIDIAQNIKV
jgi:hypothetical protein